MGSLYSSLETDGLDHAHSHGKEGSGLLWIYFVMELTGNLDKLERRRSQVCFLSFWPEQWRWKGLGKSRFYRKFCFGHVKFEMTVECWAFKSMHFHV